MALMRDILLACSQSVWLRERATRSRFVRKAVSRFMPGETPDDALAAADQLQQQGLGSVFTLLGENVTNANEAQLVTEHYLRVLDRIRALGLRTEVSVKLTQLGLDLGQEFCFENLARIIERAGAGSVVWIDMEASNYTDVTLDLYRRARLAYPNVGVCLQAYLYRTEKDLAGILPLSPAIRLVKGAYKEPPDRAFPRKRQVDENYFQLALQLLGPEARAARVRAAIATHDCKLIKRITDHAQSASFAKDSFEFQMLYGIQTQEQVRLAREGWKSIVLVAYGDFWFPWYMRRLAERPANVWFIVRNLLVT